MTFENVYRGIYNAVRSSEERDDFDLLLSKTWWDREDEEDGEWWFYNHYTPSWWNEEIYAQCYCGHRWHVGECKAMRSMSKGGRGYSRSRQCECTESLLE